MQWSPYLFFDGNCEEAFNFYARILRGKIVRLSRYGDAPGEGAAPSPESRDRIMHARLEAGDQVLMGSDACPPQYQYEGVNGFSVSLEVDSAAEAERIFKALSQGGSVQMPLDKTFWSERFGMLVDRFNIPWFINYTGNVRF